MTAREIIDRADMLEPNQFDRELKLRWLNGLDGQIWEEIIQTHEDAPEGSFQPYTEDSQELLVGFPYGEDLYLWYLQAQMALQNADPVRYEQASGAYAAALGQFTAAYNRAHLPRSSSRFWF